VNATVHASNELSRLRHEAQLFRVVVDDTPDYAFVLFTVENRVLAWNLGAERIFGYTESEALGTHGSIFFVPEDIARGAPEGELIKARQDGRAEDDRWHLRKDGSRFWGSGIMRAIYDDAGQLEGFVKILRDLTEQKRTQEALQRSEERFRLFVRHVTDYALIQVDLNGRIVAWNPGAQRVTGYTEQDICGKHLSILCTQEDIDAKFAEQELQRALETGNTEEVRWMVRKDGRRFWSRWVTTVIRDGNNQPCAFAKVMRDETERKRAEERLRASLLEKDVLLQEIHHRVKNNLQVVVSLLSIQANRVDRPDVIEILNETQNRVRAIAGIHETLYSSPDLASISFSEYMDQLIRNLFTFYDVRSSDISLKIEADDIVLDITQAIPLGLIVNELVTNALKHAFRAGRTGMVQATLRYLQENFTPDETLDEGSAVLTVEDDGIGLPAGFDVQEQETMGIYLIRILTRQLRGALQVSQGGKTQFRVVFPLKPPQ
jgi:PAS domain S-box-containing protein